MRQICNAYIGIVCTALGCLLTACSSSDNAVDNPQPSAALFTVQTTATSGNCYYEGLTIQLGFPDSDVPVAEAIIKNDGKATFRADLASFVGRQIWLCVPYVVKAYHTLTASEAAARYVTMPDKDAGSTLSTDGYTNDWAIALYMGINRDGQTSVPIYWATGNLIATKTNDANGETQVLFHIATAQESIAEGTANSTSFVGMDDRLVGQVADSYAALPAGSQWDLYSFGDATGLRLYSDVDLYVTDSKQKQGETIVYDISGNPLYDIARAQLGGSWRTPTGGCNATNEFAALEDDAEEYAQLEPNGMPWEVEGKTIGRQYQYKVKIDGRDITTNTLCLPSAGYRHGAVFAGGRGGSCWYWSATADPTAMTPYVPNGGTYTAPVNKWTTAFNYGYLSGETRWYPHPRMSGQCIRPVTEYKE